MALYDASSKWRGSGSRPTASGARTFTWFHRTVNVCGSGADADTIVRRVLAAPAASVALLLRAVYVNSRSSLVKAVPSCHVTLGLIFQVVSMVPSGSMTQVPFSTEISSGAINGSTTPERARHESVAQQIDTLALDRGVVLALERDGHGLGAARAPVSVGPGSRSGRAVSIVVRRPRPAEPPARLRC